MKNWNEITHYLGFDWAKDHHQVIVVDRQARIVADFEFEHSLEGWLKWREQVRAYPALVVAVETNQGAAVEPIAPERGHRLSGQPALRQSLPRAEGSHHQ